MSNTRYIEIDSTFRNRKEWPSPAQFEMLISQTGRKNKSDAVDPVSNAAVSHNWSSNNFNTTGPTATVSGIVQSIDTPGFGAAGDNKTVLTILASGGSTFQQITDYYLYSIATIVGSPTGSRILQYRYLGQSGGFDRIQITISSELSTIAVGNTININDPTDFTNTQIPLIFVPYGNMGENAYAQNILYNETLSIANNIPEYRLISGYDFQTHIMYLNTSGNTTNLSGNVVGWLPTHVYSIRKESPLIGILNNNISSTNIFSIATTFNQDPDIYRNSYIRMTSGNATGDLRLINRYETYSANSVSGSLSTVVFPSSASIRPGFYNGAYIQITSGLSTGDVRQITGYNVSGNAPNIIRTATVDSNFTAAISSGDSFTFRTGFVSEPFTLAVQTGDAFEILPFSYDNLYPFVYTGSMVSQQEMVCYEIELLNLSLPNQTLATGVGSRIAFYPYVYVELSNVSGASAGMKNTIYSNNPNATRMVFRATIDDVPNPLISSFVKIDGDGMVQTLKFKPNDNLRFSVHLPNGDIYRTIEQENFAPLQPNPEIQLSALFGIKRL
jgi:hypothetical protein